MKRALSLARRAYGRTSPNPMVGAVLVRDGVLLGEGLHRRAGQPHAEVEALRNAVARGNDPSGATLYVTLEPCSTHGRTPPCTGAILDAGVQRVVIGAVDPNPAHAGRGLRLLRRRGIAVTRGVLEAECTRLNEAFNHWIVTRRPFVIMKAAMTLDGKIATVSGESRWITGEASRRHAMRLRLGADAILAGVNTVLADDPALTRRARGAGPKQLRRIVLDSRARTPLDSRVVNDAFAANTTIVVTRQADARRVDELRARVNVWVTPKRGGRVDLNGLLDRLGAEEVTSLLVEGGGEVNGAFVDQGLVNRVAFFYAPIVLGGRDARKGVAGDGARSLAECMRLKDVEQRRLGGDLFVTARVETKSD